MAAVQQERSSRLGRQQQRWQGRLEHAVAMTCRSRCCRVTITRSSTHSCCFIVAYALNRGGGGVHDRACTYICWLAAGLPVVYLSGQLRPSSAFALLMAYIMLFSTTSQGFI